ncbi:MAG: hypothetical protein E7Z90_06545 [Cyanobacteria bacterium SIG29]|nr:hypothetical protein [Cyanobacteria bacterium SIG29]
MKKFLIFSIIFLSSALFLFAKEEAPDPLYLSTPVLDASKLEVKMKEEDPRTLKEKLREKFHLPPSKKVYYHNIDLSQQPVTMDDYYRLAVEKKRKDFVIPKPIFVDNQDFILPDKKFRVIRYNTPPGQRNIDLSRMIAQRSAYAPAILSPDKTKMVYTQSVYLPKFAQTMSYAYLINTEPEDAYNLLYNTNSVQAEIKPIVEVGNEEIIKYQFKTLFPIDWSRDSSKIAFKEKIGSNLTETWKTNVIIYDFENKSWKRLTAVREAILYWWRQNKQIELNNYMWDIYPIGWDKNNPDRLVVYAYAFTKDNPLFLGTWSIDYNEEKSKLMSIDSTNVEIDLNGFGLKEIKLEN